MVTCYDYTSARIIDQTDVDCVLVGDSGSMVALGKKDTTQATLSGMQFMTQAVCRGITNKFIVSDLPFMSYRRSLSETIDAVTTLVQAGAQAVKLEGVSGNLDTITHIVNSGVPVMGHIGLTPQFVHGLGGFKVQGKTLKAADRLVKEAKQLESAGCFSVVLECVPAVVAQAITEYLSIPTIGIGAGPQTDGQVLVLADLLGLNLDFKPKFVKTYLNGSDLFKDAINQYVSDVCRVKFPSDNHIFTGELV